MKKINLFIILIAIATISYGQVDGSKRGVKYSDGVQVNAITPTVKAKYDKVASDTLQVSVLLNNTQLTGIPKAPTAITGDTTSQISNNKFVTTNDRYFNELKTIGFIGDLLPAFINASSGSGVTEAMVSQRVRYCMFLPKETKTYRYLYFYLETAGVYTASNVNGFCFYSTSGETNTKITATETTTANMWTTQGLNIVTLSAPVTMTAGVIYKVAYMYSSSAQTTAPVLATWGTIKYAGSLTSIVSNTEQPQSRIETRTSFASSGLNTALSGVNTVPLVFLKE
jgi:hypothetical protein